MKVVLLGYMASGKSSVGKVLADSLELNFIDLDNYIEAKEKRTITEIFTQKGEIYFRLKEITYLKEILDSKEKIVLSVGGGTPCFGDSMKLINEKSTAIYLKASIRTLVNRLNKEKQSRPLVANLTIEKMNEFIGKHLFERSYFYEKSKHIIKIDDKTTEEIAGEIESQLI